VDAVVDTTVEHAMTENTRVSEAGNHWRSGLIRATFVEEGEYASIAICGRA
jgi:hypothetical protein